MDKHMWWGKVYFTLKGHGPHRPAPVQLLWKCPEDLVFTAQHLNKARVWVRLCVCVNSVTFNSCSLGASLLLAGALRGHLADGCWSLSAKSCQSWGTSGLTMFHQGPPIISRQSGTGGSRAKFKNENQTQTHSRLIIWCVFGNCFGVFCSTDSNSINNCYGTVIPLLS